MIREAISTDREIYIDLSSNFYSSPACDHNVSVINFENTFDYCMQGNPFYKILICECDGKIAGYGTIAFSYSNEANGHFALLDELYISPEFRSKGIGKEYFQFVFDNYKMARYRLEVTESNTRAKQLYETLGFSYLDYQQMVKDIL